MDEQSVAQAVGAEDVAIGLRDGMARLNRRLRQVQPVGSLTQSQLSALTSLELAGSLSPTELAEVERVQPPTMTRIVAKLEAMGLVGRVPHHTDRRQSILSTTELGRHVYAEHRRARDAWLTGHIASLPAADRDTLAGAAEILRRLARQE